MCPSEVKSAICRGRLQIIIYYNNSKYPNAWSVQSRQPGHGKQLNTTAAHKSYWRREEATQPTRTCSINPCYQNSPSLLANCTPASWPSLQPKTAKLVTSSSNPAQCGHHTLGWVLPCGQYECDILHLLTAPWYCIVSCWDSCPYPGLNSDIFLEYVSVVISARSLAFWCCGVFMTCSAIAVRAVLTYFNGI